MDLQIVIPPRYSDLFQDQDVITIGELFDTIEELDYEIDKEKEKHDDYRQYVEDNYRFVGQAEQVGISDRDFIEVE